MTPTLPHVFDADADADANADARREHHSRLCSQPWLMQLPLTGNMGNKTYLRAHLLVHRPPPDLLVGTLLVDNTFVQGRAASFRA